MQIKPWLHNLLLRGILSASIVMMCTVTRSYASFNTGVYCTIRGNMYHDGFKVYAISRDDFCALINESINGNAIILWNSKHWVTIIVPKSYPGMYILRYKWGSDDAYIGDQLIHIEWGLVMRG